MPQTLAIDCSDGSSPSSLRLGGPERPCALCVSRDFDAHDSHCAACARRRISRVTRSAISSSITQFARGESLVLGQPYSRSSALTWPWMNGLSACPRSSRPRIRRPRSQPLRGNRAASRRADSTFDEPHRARRLLRPPGLSGESGQTSACAGRFRAESSTRCPSTPSSGRSVAILLLRGASDAAAARPLHTETRR